MQRELHTPEGMRDIMDEECRNRKLLSGRLMNVFHAYGYEDIETPVIEYFDVFSKEIGTTPSRDLYKFFDRNGDTLVLRPDFTPSIARAVAMYMQERTLPLRLCYQGKTFVNASSYKGHLNESTQLGMEYIGDDSVYADAETIALAVRVLSAAGLKNFQISIGEVDFFKALVEEAGLSPETEEVLRDRISNKNLFGVDDLLETQQITAELSALFHELPRLFGGMDMLKRVQTMTGNPKALQAIERLCAIYDTLKLFGVESYISFDLSLLSKFRYYTGIIFQGFTYGTGEPVLKGGRYDRLLAYFNKDMPAIGFGMIIENVYNALERQNIGLPSDSNRVIIVYKSPYMEKAIAMAAAQRKEGFSVSLYAYAEEKDFGRLALEKKARLITLY